MPHPFFGSPEQRPLILGHRGAAGATPENTLVSFECGLESGAHILESDVHLSRDGVPILLHDPEVDRTSDGSGSVADLDLAAIQALDAGYRFSPDEGESFPYRAKGLTIPTLQDLVAERAPEHLRGVLMALWVAGLRVGQTTGPLIAGVAIGLWSTSTVLVLAGGAVGCLAVVLAASRILPSGRPVAPTGPGSATDVNG